MGAIEDPRHVVARACAGRAEAAAGWKVRYLVVDTSNWIGGRTVLVSPDWVRRVDWNQREIHVDMSREAVKASPDYDPTIELSRDYESRLHGHYQRPAYWK